MKQKNERVDIEKSESEEKNVKSESVEKNVKNESVEKNESKEMNESKEKNVSVEKNEGVGGEQPAAGHRLSEVIEAYNGRVKRAAMEAYLDGEAHGVLRLADEMAQACRESAERLCAGDVAPRLDVLRTSVETLAKVLSALPLVTYSGLDMADDPFAEEPDEEDPATRPDPILSDETFARLTSLPTADLKAELEDGYACISARFAHTHREDSRAQEALRTALVERFRKGAAFAKGVGSESAKTWLDAERLLTPRSPLEDAAPEMWWRTFLLAEDVRAAYARAEEAQGRLWVDVQFAALGAKPSEADGTR